MSDLTNFLGKSSEMEVSSSSDISGCLILNGQNIVSNGRNYISDDDEDDVDDEFYDDERETDDDDCEMDIEEVSSSSDIPPVNGEHVQFGRLLASDQSNQSTNENNQDEEKTNNVEVSSTTGFDSQAENVAQITPNEETFSNARKRQYSQGMDNSEETGLICELMKNKEKSKVNGIAWSVLEKSLLSLIETSNQIAEMASVQQTNDAPSANEESNSANGASNLVGTQTVSFGGLTFKAPITPEETLDFFLKTQKHLVKALKSKMSITSAFVAFFGPYLELLIKTQEYVHRLELIDLRAKEFKKAGLAAMKADSEFNRLRICKSTQSSLDAAFVELEKKVDIYQLKRQQFLASIEIQKAFHPIWIEYFEKIKSVRIVYGLFLGDTSCEYPRSKAVVTQNQKNAFNGRQSNEKLQFIKNIAMITKKILDKIIQIITIGVNSKEFEGSTLSPIFARQRLTTILDALITESSPNDKFKWDDAIKLLFNEEIEHLNLDQLALNFSKIHKVFVSEAEMQLYRLNE